MTEHTTRNEPEPHTDSIPVPAPGVELPEELAEAVETEISYDEQFYPARPRSLRPRARRRHSFAGDLHPPFDPVASNKAYVEWLVNQSMLHDATTLSRQLSGQPEMWSMPYARPNPRRAVDTASVWFTAYPLSFITRPGQSFLAALGGEDLWDAFARIGIRAIHTGPVKLAGGISGWSPTPSIDGHFDRISLTIDPLFGTEEDFRSMQEVAAARGATIIDDIVPGHTGKGADFLLAQMNHHDYPGIYHMVSIPREAWSLLPDVPEGLDSVNLDPGTEQRLKKAGYIIGELQRVIFYEPGVKETNWSATREMLGTDGQTHRWVYLHYFKDGQPSINWLDPSFAGMRLVMGDALHSLLDLGAGGLRLDANGFLGVERAEEDDEAEEQDDATAPAWSEGHPLSVAANQLIGSMVRKVGGFTFQELNLTVDAIRATSVSGPDLSYDFITRPAYHHAFATGDTEFLRLTLHEGVKIGIDQASLVHALQNHDELTYELVHFATAHRADEYTYQGRTLLGAELGDQIRAELRHHLTGEAGPYNAVFTQNGIASTTLSVVAAALGYRDLAEITADDVPRLRAGHLLLAAYNALQPGVFALSGWDLAGILPLDHGEVADLIRTGDTRWIERGAHDLMDWNPAATESSAGMPRARSLYGALPQQLEDPDSFASRLSSMLHLRESHGIATGALLEVPEVGDPALLVLVNRLAVGAVQLSVFNFSERELTVRIASEHLSEGQWMKDLGTWHRAGDVDAAGGFLLELGPFGFRALIAEEPDAPDGGETGDTADTADTADTGDTGDVTDTASAASDRAVS
ncbi:maltose alpha-D-glucosyltransferase [Pseudactinotalea sp. HY158]|uniref:maltose alpha-D-glucosyltransferase n=1 Tax=Pseudactinotalea sp. HY158 TaxID=2654547 RepID=UPI00129C4EC6|nr:maltose alpha-D-glucosyltransferase [Pseudactinotalea sp. HY158]QGH68255.1 maltose alpha-D-glucosyltransferase [Pseudactinotalea sp. HY158]